MSSFFRNLTLIVFTFFFMENVLAQKPNELKWNFNKDSTHFFKFTCVNQVWLRHTQNNPGSTAFGDPVNNSFDIGIRRLRMQAYGQINERIFLYTQFGLNNFTWMQNRFTGAFFHDAVAEFRIRKDWMNIGAGLTGWSGLSRYASPAVGSILSLDAPLYQQATNGVTDQFLRKLSVYAKGKISRLDYRVALSHPMAAQTGNVANSTSLDSGIASFSARYPSLQTQGYFKWEFLDKESNQLPYFAGTYLGKRRIFNIGAGFIHQPKAMWQQNGKNSDTIYHPMNLWSVDVFYDAPLNKEKENAITAYAAFSIFDFGQNHLRMLGVMNPLNGVNANASLNGTGNGFPAIGTGNILYAEVGYLAGKNLLKNHDRIQLFAGTQIAGFQALHERMIMYQTGMNYYISGNAWNKISLMYQNRPVYHKNSDEEARVTSRKGMVTVQLQVGI
ncbi:MAG: hypothetical protein KG003_03240 [Bacteroidetes bacterium]|nr:hypothetical protein [Bacteroidota bacterium]